MLFFLLNSLNKIHAFYQYRCVTCGGTTVRQPFGTGSTCCSNLCWCTTVMVLRPRVVEHMSYIKHLTLYSAISTQLLCTGARPVGK